MKTLKILMVLIMSLSLSACLEGEAGSAVTGGSGGSDGGNGGGDGTGGFPGTSGAKVTAISSNTVSNFGGQVVLTVDDIAKGVVSVESEIGSMTFSVSGHDVTVQIPADAIGTGSGINLKLKDINGDTYGFDVSNMIRAQAGLEISTVVLADSTPLNGYDIRNGARIHETSQKLFYIAPDSTTGGKPSFIDMSGNVTVVALEPDPATPNEMIYPGFDSRMGGDYIYVPVANDPDNNDGLNNFYLRRYHLDGSRDYGFAKINMGQSGGHYVDEDSTYIYVQFGQSPSIYRFSKTDGTKDTGFHLVMNKNSIPNYSDSMLGDTYRITSDTLKMKFLGDKIYVQSDGCKGDTLVCDNGVRAPVMMVFNLTDGSAAFAPGSIATEPYYLIFGHYVQGGTYGANIPVFQPGNNVQGFDFLVESSGFFQFGAGTDGQIIRSNADRTPNLSFYSQATPGMLTDQNWKDADWKTPQADTTRGFRLTDMPIFNQTYATQQNSIGFAPVRVRTLDMVRLDSGNLMVITAEDMDGAAPAAKMVCATIMDDTGVPIRGMRETRYCAALAWDALVVNGVTNPGVYLVRNETGKAYSRVGNTYRYAIQGTKLWGVSFDVNE